MKTMYMIKQVFGGTCTRVGVFPTRELAETQLSNLPDTWTDYDHYTVEEVPCIESEDELLVGYHGFKKRNTEKNSND